MESQRGLPPCLAGGRRAPGGRSRLQTRARRGRARPSRCGRLLQGCRGALGPLSVCWQEAPAHAVLVNIQTRDFSQSKSTSTFFENLPKNSKRREFLASLSMPPGSKFATTLCVTVPSNLLTDAYSVPFSPPTLSPFSLIPLCHFKGTLTPEHLTMVET